jgi:hypothetical protein
MTFSALSTGAEKASIPTAINIKQQDLKKFFLIQASIALLL